MPDSPPRGAVVLCPPIGREYVSSHATFVRLARSLTELGFAALRFDYRSTGDSFDRAPDLADEPGFARDVQLALDFVRETGFNHVGIVGMRLGANFAISESRFQQAEALVLWDPCWAGRSFVREQRALGLINDARAAEESAGGRDLPGFKMSAAMTQEIEGLDFQKGHPGLGETAGLAGAVLLLTRSERRPYDIRLAEVLDWPNVEHVEVAGQPELLEVMPHEQTIPSDTVATVAEWLDKVICRAGERVTLEAASEVTVRMASRCPSANGATPGSTVTLIKERAVSLGPAGLFGLETGPIGGGAAPACIFVSVAVGSGRLWVQLSRRLAVAGFRCVRIDVSAGGDSPARDGNPFYSVHSLLAIDDVLEVVKAVSPEDRRDVMLFGVCAAGYDILEASLAFFPRAVCVINPSSVFQPPEMASGGPMDDRRLFCLPRTALVEAARERYLVKWVGRRFPTLLSSARGPTRAIAWRLRRFFVRPKNRPGQRLEDLVARGTDVLLVCGPQEIRPFLETGLHSPAPDGRREGLRIEVIPTLEHALLWSRDREEVTDLMFDHVVARFAEHRPVEGLAEV